ncbi:MAG: nucleotidyltransferase family protein [Lachnospiraceae bacterium]
MRKLLRGQKKIEAEQANQNVVDVLYLLRCILNDVSPEISYIKKMRLEEIYRSSRRHSIEAMTYLALNSVGKPLIEYIKLNSQEELWKKWGEAMRKSMVRNLQLDIGRAEICNYMESIGCWYMPLKGIILKELYPSDGMRQMGDNDILFDEAFRSQIRDWFIEQNYEVGEYQENSNHDAYWRSAGNHYEMHKTLVPEVYTVWYDYYKNIKEKLLPMEGTHYGYQFTDEDFYVFMVVHAYKHYKNGGIGFRALTDFYVYIKEKGSSLNWSYIEQECTKLDIAKFEAELRLLAYKVLCPKKSTALSLNEEELQILEYIVDSGTYGTITHSMLNQVKKQFDEKPTFGKKVFYMIRRIFTSPDIIKKNYEICNKYPIFIPIGYIARIFRGLFSKNVRLEVGAILKVKQKKKGDKE